MRICFALFALLALPGCAGLPRAVRPSRQESSAIADDGTEPLSPNQADAIKLVNHTQAASSPSDFLPSDHFPSDTFVARAQSDTSGLSSNTRDTGDPIVFGAGIAGNSIARLPPVDRLQIDMLNDLTRADSVGNDITYAALMKEQASGIVEDWREFYSLEGLTWLAGGISAGALMANTGFDEHFVRDSYVDSVVLAPSHEFFEKLHQPKFLGDGIYTIPAFVVTAVAEPLIDDLPLGRETAEWGQRSLRTILVGGPPMLAAQLLTGGSRPGETTAHSKWKPLQDDNGVSGHSFMGAIPFMSAAKMTDNLAWKGGLYVASAMPALSRINDDSHYFSQAFLGWWFAYVASSAVDRAHHQHENHEWYVYPQSDGLGVAVESRW